MSQTKETILKEYTEIYQLNRDYLIILYLFRKENQELYNMHSGEVDKFENILLVGRYAKFKYYNIDDVVKKALEVFGEGVV